MRKSGAQTRILAAAASVCGLGALLVAADALGQASPPAAQAGDATRTPPEKTEPKPVPSNPVPEAPPGSPSDKLSRQKGVIEPPKGIDTEMSKAPPDEGKMRVIRPPGSGQGPSNVEPK
jgi:hypothetical protein